MSEYQIIFSTEMVSAILDGRKTQTRRVIKPQPVDEFGKICECKVLGPEFYSPVVVDRHGEEQPGKEIYGVYDEYGEWGVKSPYGSPGDLLYVRETWRPADRLIDGFERMKGGEYWIQYKAGGAVYNVDWDTDKVDQDYDADSPEKLKGTFSIDPKFGRWLPSIHLPKNYSRLWLRVLDVRVERVRDITPKDASAEGCSGLAGMVGINTAMLVTNTNSIEEAQDVALIDDFAYLWDSINAKRGYGWKVNPWVWVIEFEKVQR